MDTSKGYPVGKVDDLDAYKIRNQCLKYEAYYVRLEGGDPRKLRPIPMEVGGDGIYTFLFDQTRRLHTAKVSNQFEIGSLHLTLAYEGNVKSVLAAGEMKKTGNKVVFNLLSGTYMKPWMAEVDDDMSIREQALELFQEAGIDAVYTDSPFITAKHVPVTKEQLHSYVDAGFTVKLFTDRKTCMLEPLLLNAQLTEWRKRPEVYKDAIQNAEEQLRLANEFTLYKKGGRRMTRRYCKKTPCRKMGFSQKASCRPYKNCYLLRKTRRTVA
jgi:hypothetical protein